MKNEIKKMNCFYYRDKIEDYLEGRLNENERLSFEDHLKSCPACTEMIQVQKIADKIIAEEKKSVPGFYLTGRIMNRIVNSDQQTSSAFFRILKPALITISIAAAVFAGILIGNISSLSNDKRFPVELMLMNDVSIESVNLLIEE